ncbi:hypothetical protein Esti_005964 [Eimeria stiedai]
MLAAHLQSVAAATAAAATAALRLRRCWSVSQALFLPVLGLLSFSHCGVSAAAAGPSGAAARENRAITLNTAPAGSEYILGSAGDGVPCGLPNSEGHRAFVDSLSLDASALRRNEMYGERFISRTEELRSVWQKCQQENAALATVRTNLHDFVGFAACAELNLELDDVFVDVHDGRSELAYKWLLYPKEAVGTDVRLRRAVSQSVMQLLLFSLFFVLVPSGANDGCIAIHYNSPLSTAKVTDAATFSFSVTQGDSLVLGSLLYKEIVIQDKKLVTYPEISVGTESELCGLSLLRSLLKRAQVFGLEEVRIRVESSNIPLLKAVSCTGFRPVDIVTYQSRAHHVFVANPQLPLPAVSELKHKMATLALQNQQEGKSSLLGAEPSALEEKAAVDGRHKGRGPHKPQESEAVNLKKLFTPAELTGVGAILLVLFAELMWRRRKRAACVSLGTRRLPLQLRARAPSAHATYQDDRYFSPSPHWRDRQHVESVYESLSSEESDHSKATGQLNG